MKFYFRLAYILIYFLLSFNCYALQDSIKVVVIDEKENLIQNVTVLLKGNKKCVTNKKGVAYFVTDKKLVMPFMLEVVKDGYEIKEFVYFQEEKEIEVTLKKISDKELTSILLLSFEDLPMPNISFTYQGNVYITDENGSCRIHAKDLSVDLLAFPKHEVFSYIPGKRTIIVLKDKAEPVELLASDPNQLPNGTSMRQLDEASFSQYKSDFEMLSRVILAERNRLESNNAKIREEISKISEKLKSEDNLSANQRKQIERYIRNLEKTLYDNSLAYQKAEEQTAVLIEKLKKIIQEKDSINYLTRQKYELAELQRIEEEKLRLKAEERTQRNLIVFSVVTVVLLLLAAVFYAISIKMRKQKNELRKANEQLNKVKNVLAENIVKINKQKELIEEQNNEMDMFVNKASHDLKGPLNSLLGLTKVAVKTVSDQNALEIFAHINKSIEKLHRLVTDLLKLSKLKKTEVVKESVNLSKVIANNLQSFNHFLGFERMQFEVDVPESFELYSDRTLFSSIVQNFIENAIKYSDPAKEQSFLKIKAWKEAGFMNLSFIDNGLGISKENFPLIFDMFYKINEGSNGSGLGLYIVKNNIEKLGGKIIGESVEGEGTSFVLQFPNEECFEGSINSLKTDSV